MPRFVLLEHDHPFLHWDLMLEDAGSLRTWRLSAPPRAGAVAQATALGNHRLAYLDYEGLVSGNRGSVTRWDRGTYTIVEDAPGRLVVKLQGQKVRGTAILWQEQAEGWTFCIASDA
jgi:hypothetical protein